MKQGRVIINRNICDNAAECSGIFVCPTGALYWDEDKEEIAYNPDICIDCGACADASAGGCPIGAILWGCDDEDYSSKKISVDKETMTLDELEVERYGASPIEEPIDATQVQEQLENSKSRTILLEFYSDETICCLLHSIRIEDIARHIGGNVLHKKVCVSNVSECTVGKVSELPALVVLRDGKAIGTINGYYSDESKESLFEELSSITEK